MKNFAWLSTVPEDFSGEWSRQAVLLGMIERSGVRVVPGIAINAEVARQFFQQRPVRRAVARLFADALATSTDGLVQVSAALRGSVRTSSLPTDVAQQLTECASSLTRSTLPVTEKQAQYRVFWDGHSVIRSGSTDEALRSVYASQFKPAHMQSQVLHHDLRIIAYPVFLQLCPRAELSGTVSTDRSGSGDQTVLVAVVDGQDTYRINLKDGVLLSEHPERQSAFTASTQQALVRIARKVQEALGELPTLRWVATAQGVQVQEVVEECVYAPMPEHIGESSGTLTIVKGLSKDTAFTKNDIVLVDFLDSNDIKNLPDVAGLLVIHDIPPHAQLNIPVIAHIPHQVASTFRQGMFVHMDASRRFINGVTVSDQSAVRTLTTITHLAEQPLSPHGNGLLLTRSHSLLELLGVRAEHHRHEYGAVLADELLRLASLTAPSPFFYQLHDVQGMGMFRFDAITRGFAGTRALLGSHSWLVTEAVAIAEAFRRGASNLVPVLPAIHEIRDGDVIREALSKAAPNQYLWERPWVTIATPAVAINIEELVETQPKGVLVDLTTLAQLTTGTDASSQSVGHLHQDDHPAVVKMLTYLLATCRQAGIPIIVLLGEAGDSRRILECITQQGCHYVAVLMGQEERTQRHIGMFEHTNELHHWLSA